MSFRPRVPITRIWSRRAPLTCRQVVELITGYLDDALPPSTRRRLELHLAGCPDCVEYLAQIRATIALTGRIDAGSLSPEAQDDLLRLFRDWQGRADRGPED